MRVWIIMGDTGIEYEPDIDVWGVYQNESVARANRDELELEYGEDAKFWVDEWDVE